MSSPTSPTSPSSPGEEVFRALEFYTPVHDGEIKLCVGDIITSSKNLGNGWTVGKNVTRDTVGIFPTSYVYSLSDAMRYEHPPPKYKVPPPGKKEKRAANSKPTTPAVRQRELPSSPSSNSDHSPDTPEYQQPPVKSKEKPVVAHTRERSPKVIDTPSQPPEPPVSEDVDTLEKVPIEDYDLTCSELEYSSLPIPVRGKYDSGRKPHMVVKPSSQGVRGSPSGTSDKCSPDPRPNDDCSDKQSDPPLPTEDNVIDRRHAGPARRSMRARTATPPRQLPLRHPARLQRTATDLDRDYEVPDRPNTSQASRPANTPKRKRRQDCTDTPILIPPVIQQNVANQELERENAANQTNNQHSPPRVPSEGIAELQRQYYRDYRTMECPTELKDKDSYMQPTKYKPILRNRNQKVGDSKGQHISYKDTKKSSTSSRLIFSFLAGVIIGLAVFMWMYYYLGYTFLIAIGVSASIGLIQIIWFAISRLCRCVGALMLPSLCTTRGRISFLFLITGFLLGGPVTNIYHNMMEISRSMSCSAEQTYNQTMLLLEPFDGMMQQLNTTVVKLHSAADTVNSSLRPLGRGLERMEEDLLNGKLQLTGTGRICRQMVSQAFNECTTGITAAQGKCLGVMGALGIVYHHAREVLDRINPDKWAPKNQHLYRRDVILADSELEDIELPGGDGDICEPLDINSVCNTLNNTERLCQPSVWAAEAIEDAINATQAAMRRLETTLHFQISAKPYYNTRVNASSVIYEVKKHVQEEFSYRTAYFEMVISILLKIIPVSLLLLVYVAYLHVKYYMSRDTYDNNYVTEQFRALDHKRSEVAGESLLPLRKYERHQIIDMTVSDLSPPEDRLYRIGLCVLFLHLLITVLCYLFDYILFWVLTLVEKHASPTFDVTGKDSLELVISGEGVVVDLLKYFLEGFHPGNLFGYTADTYACLPRPRGPSILNLLVIFAMYFVLILTILLKAYILRFRNKITGYFYPDREKVRVVHLYNVILNQRARMPRILQQKARISNRETIMQEEISLLHKMAARCPPCRIFLYKSSRCLVCNAIEDQSFRDCDTERCNGVYCSDCYDDMGRLCPLCMHGNSHYYEGDDDYEEVDDDIQPYCRSSKIYL